MLVAPIVASKISKILCCIPYTFILDGLPSEFREKFMSNTISTLVYFGYLLNL